MQCTSLHRLSPAVRIRVLDPSPERFQKAQLVPSQMHLQYSQHLRKAAVESNTQTIVNSYNAGETLEQWLRRLPSTASSARSCSLDAG